MSQPIVRLDTTLASARAWRREGGLRPRTAEVSGRPSCATDAGLPLPAIAVPSAAEQLDDHPCYSTDAAHEFARLHLPVAPGCNIQCNYCNRKYDCANETRPGVTSKVLTPEQAVRRVAAVAAKMPQLAVIGIAGPGDALYNPKNTFETFERIRDRFPDLKLCLSTNGLALPEHVDRIVELGIGHVTITVNFIDPAIGEQIYPWIFFNHRRYTGREAATILHERQMEGLDRLAAAGTLVKINSVLIPDINGSHLKEVNAEVLRRGAAVHNVMPLISDPVHGTVFGLEGRRGPTPEELQEVQASLGGKVMRHCRQCRSDAVGLLGEDQSGDLDLLEGPDEIIDDPEPRRRYRELVARERADRKQAAAAATATVADTYEERTLLVAVCTRGGGRVNQHFGHAEEFTMYEVDRDGIRAVGVREVDRYCAGGGDDERLARTVAALEGVSAVLCAKMGARPRAVLSAIGIKPIEDPSGDYIETALGALYRAETEERLAEVRLTA